MKLDWASRPERLWLLGGALAALALLIWVTVVVVSAHQAASSRLAEIEPRYARVAGLLQNSERLTQADQAVKSNLAEFAYPAEGEAGQVGNQALQRVRDIATTHGLRVASSQVAASREDKGFDRLGLSMRVEGDWAQLQGMLIDLARLRPVVYSESIQIGAQGGPVPGRKLDVAGQFDLYVLKERRQ